MSYSRKVYVKAASTLERRRSKAERTQSMHREEAYAKMPELISIDREISSAGAEVIRAIGMGENAQRFIEEQKKKNLAAQQRRKDTQGVFAVPPFCQLCQPRGSRALGLKGFVHGKLLSPPHIGIQIQTLSS